MAEEEGALAWFQNAISIVLVIGDLVISIKYINLDEVTNVIICIFLLISCVKSR